METYLLFRNARNGRIENTMYDKNDPPLYVQPINKGVNKGYYVDILSNKVIYIDKSIVKYACIVNDEDLSIKTYYDEDCKLINAPKGTFYRDAYYF